jgi:hypothetical protein
MMFERASDWPSVEEGLAALTLECKTWCRKRKIYLSLPRPFSLATLSISKAKDYPTLETKAKASKCKILFLWICSTLVSRYVQGQDCTEYHRIRANMLWRIQNVVHILDRAGPLLAQEQATTVYNDGWMFLRIYSYLSTMALREGVSGYKVRRSIPHDLGGEEAVRLHETPWKSKVPGNTGDPGRAPSPAGLGTRFGSFVLPGAFDFQGVSCNRPGSS